jgi:Reductase C-terminal
VDKYMRVQGVEDVYASGDIATFPYFQQGGKPLRIEHWDVAINHGRSVANHIVKGDSFEGIHLHVGLMLGMTSTAFFWSAQGAQLRFCGTTGIDGFDEVILQGDTNPLNPTFSGFYVKNNKVVAVVSVGTDPTVSLSAELLYGISSHKSLICRGQVS